MNATVFLFATKEVVEAFENQLDKAFGPANWRIEGREYDDVWGTPPEDMKLKVTNKEGETLGHIEVCNRYETTVQHDGEPFATAVPEKANIFNAAGEKVDLFPNKVTVTVTVEVVVEYSEDLTEQEAIDVTTQNMDGNFSYYSDNVRIVKSEITDTNE